MVFVAIPATMLAVLTGSIGWVLLVRPFYYAQIGAAGTMRRQWPHSEQVRAAYGDVMDYCLGLRPDFAAGVLPFSAEGASHFADVRMLFILNMAVLAVTVAFLLGLRIDCERRSEALPRLGGRTPVLGRLRSGRGHSGSGRPGPPRILDRAFTVFHSIFFPGKTTGSLTRPRTR